MNKAFEKILERLEKERIILLKNNLHQAIALNFAKEIVQEVAEEYNISDDDEDTYIYQSRK